MSSWKICTHFCISVGCAPRSIITGFTESEYIYFYHRQFSKVAVPIYAPTSRVQEHRLLPISLPSTRFGNLFHRSHSGVCVAVSRWDLNFREACGSWTPCVHFLAVLLCSFMKWLLNSAYFLKNSVICLFLIDLKGYYYIPDEFLYWI